MTPKEANRSGLCDGGPYHGQWLATPLNQTEVVVPMMKRVTFYAPNDDSVEPEITHGRYRWQFGIWCWDGSR
jgi:hypothetical protein